MRSLAFASGFSAAKKSDIRIPESSNWIKSAGVMPWRWAISNTSTIAHSTSSGFGSRDSSISLFIESPHKCQRFHVQRSELTFCWNALLLCCSILHRLTIADLVGIESPRRGRFFGYAKGRLLGDVFPDHECGLNSQMRMVDDSKLGKFREFSVT